MAWMSYSLVCTLHYLIIVVRMYLKVLNVWQCVSGIYCRVCMSTFKSILSLILYAIYQLCLFQPTYLLYWFQGYLYIIIKSRKWMINDCLGLGHGIRICAICLVMFLQSIPWMQMTGDTTSESWYQPSSPCRSGFRFWLLQFFGIIPIKDNTTRSFESIYLW